MESQHGTARRAGAGWAAPLATLLLGFAATAAPAWAEPKPASSWVPAHANNYTVRGSRSITYVVIHDIEGGAPGAIAHMRNPHSGVSAHYVIGYEGHLTQMVADHNIAWHAGNWSINEHSIGIEHAGRAATGGYTEAEYAKSAALVRWLCDTYGIPKNRHHIIAHAEVPDPDGSGYGGSHHHWDPGPHWNWTHFMALVTGGGGGGGSSSGGGGVSPPPPAPPAPPSSGGGRLALKVTASALNVRAGAGTGHAIVGGIGSGQVYVSMTSSGAWRKIWFRGNTGWCHGSYLTHVHATARKVTVDALNVRSGPSTGHAAVGRAHDGEMYVTTGTSGAWRKIWFGGAGRWFHGGYTSEVGL
ncbi:MAG: N-acetylmuramoyl-L-alanine amidase [Planctomycetes bacterium]|nr:N-acetylmuramoyl-L-alanine amidase [Planctomycetota bacterium]